jgi:hypothetical protein
LKKLLQSVPSEGGRSAWDNFVQAIFDFLKKAFNIKMQRSVLDDIYQLVENYINNTPAVYAQQKLVEAGMSPADFTELAMTPNEIVDLAIREGVVTIEELRALKTKTEETIPDDIYDEFIDTGEVPSEIIQDIAEKIANGKELTTREESVRQSKASDIEEILQTLKSGDPAIDTNGLPNYTVEEIEGQGFTPKVGEEYLLKQPDGSPMFFQTEDDLHAYVKRQFEEEETKTGSEKAIDAADDLSAPVDADSDFLAGQLGLPVNEEQQPFYIEGDDVKGYSVVTKDGTAFPEKFASREAAEEFIKERMDVRDDVTFGLEYMGDLSQFEEPTHLVDRFITRSRQSLSRYNKANGTSIESLEDYANTPEGADALDMIKESVLTNMPLDKIKQQRKKEKKEQEIQITEPTLFDTTETPSDTPAVTIDYLERLRTVALESLGKGASNSDALAAVESRRNSAKEDSKNPGGIAAGNFQSVGKVVEKDLFGKVTKVVGVLDTGKGAVVTISATSLEDYFEKVDNYYDSQLKFSKATEQLEKTEKMSKFVEGTPSPKVTDQDIYNDLKDILGCA